jgi:hypothetical protein
VHQPLGGSTQGSSRSSTRASRRPGSTSRSCARPSFPSPPRLRATGKCSCWNDRRWQDHCRSSIPRDRPGNRTLSLNVHSEDHCCVSAAALAAFRGRKDGEITRRILDHVNQRFRFSYVLGRGSTVDDDDIVDDNEPGAWRSSATRSVRSTQCDRGADARRSCPAPVRRPRAAGSGQRAAGVRNPISLRGMPDALWAAIVCARSRASLAARAPAVVA